MEADNTFGMACFTFAFPIKVMSKLQSKRKRADRVINTLI